MSPASRLRTLLADRIVVAPGVFDGLSAHLTRLAGFEAMYASGGAIARSMGYPDIGLVGPDEIINRLELICEAAAVPVIADADTGYGNALNTYRAVQRFERAGVAALHLEDQSFPKRCGHLDGKSLVPVTEMAQKLRAACDARRDPDLVIIARTDAIAVEGFDAAIDRAAAYAEAGADVLFVEAPTSEAEIAAVGQRLSQPLLINMFHGGKTPMVPLARLAEFGYRIVIIPSDLQRAAMRAMTDTLQAIRQDGNSMAIAERLASFSQRESVVGTDAYFARDAGYAGTPVDSEMSSQP